MKELRNITVIGLGLLGGSILLSVKRGSSNLKLVGYAHRKQTREKAKSLLESVNITGDLAESVQNAQLVVLATPVQTFEKFFRELAPLLPKGCIVTDVGSTKTCVHRWAKEYLSDSVTYIGSHPIAGSEQRGVDFARDDLFFSAPCIITTNASKNQKAFQLVKNFWEQLGCRIVTMTPNEHDRTYADISHLPHIVAAALVNASNEDNMKHAGKGFIDTSRVASGPANIWLDILMTNRSNCKRGINRMIKELQKMSKALQDQDTKKIEKLLQSARDKRSRMIDYKVKKKELMQ